MSSKLEMSAKMPSVPDSWEEEWKEDDFEDLDPESSGGEFGVVQMVVISSNGSEFSGCRYDWRRTEMGGWRELN